MILGGAMKKEFLGYDGPVFRLIARIIELIKLNIITIIFCLPIITIGASLTAAHYAVIKMYRNEGYVTKNFWNSFKQNFLQSTWIWILILVWFLLTSMVRFTFGDSANIISLLIQGMMIMVTIIVIFTIMWVFPVQARFVNSTVMVFVNSFRLSIKNIFKTIYMIMMHILPSLLLMASVRWMGVVLMIGISGPIYFSAGVYDRVFVELERRD